MYYTILDTLYSISFSYAITQKHVWYLYLALYKNFESQMFEVNIYMIFLGSKLLCHNSSIHMTLCLSVLFSVYFVIFNPIYLIGSFFKQYMNHSNVYNLFFNNIHFNFWFLPGSSSVEPGRPRVPPAAPAPWAAPRPFWRTVRVPWVSDSTAWPPATRHRAPCHRIQPKVNITNCCLISKKINLKLWIFFQKKF